MRLTDGSGSRTFASFHRANGFFQPPEAQVDKLMISTCYTPMARIRSTIRSSIQKATYSQETYDYVASRPRCKSNQEGEISVAGGVRRVLPRGVRTKPAAAAEEASKPKP